MAWDDVKNFLGQALGDVSLFLRPASTWGEIPDVIQARHEEAAQPQARQSLIGSPFRAGLLGVGGKDVGGQFQPDIPEGTAANVLQPVHDPQGNAIPGVYIGPDGKLFKGGLTFAEVVDQAKKIDPNFDLSKYRLSGLQGGGVRVEPMPGALPPPPEGMVPKGARLDPKGNRYIPYYGLPDKPKPGAQGMTRQQAIDMGLDPDALGITDTAPDAEVPTPPGVVKRQVESGAEQIGLDPRFADAVAKNESGFRPGAVSPKGARGTMQVMPATSDRVRREQAAGTIPKPAGVSENIAEGEGELAGLTQTYARLPSPVREQFVAAAYNAGQQRVDDARRQVLDRQGNPDDFEQVAPFLPQETRTFVSNVFRDWQGGQGGRPPVSRLGPTGGAKPAAVVPPAPPGAAPAAKPKLLKPDDWLAAHPDAQITRGPHGVTVTMRSPPRPRPKAAPAEKPPSPQALQEIEQLKILDDNLGSLETMLGSPDVTSRLGPVRGRAAWLQYRLGGSSDPLFDHFQTLEDLIGNLSVGRLARASGSRSYLVWQALSAHKPQAGDDPELTKSKVTTLRNLVEHTQQVSLALQGVPASKVAETLKNIPDMPDDQIVDPDIRVSLGLPPLTQGGAQTPTTPRTAPPTTTTTLPSTGDPQQDFDRHLDQWRQPQ